MRVKYFFNIVVVVSLLSCSKSNDPEIKCGTYYLSSLGSNAGAYYNSDGMISEYVNGTDTIAKFEYNNDKQLKSRKSHGFDVNYYYDETKKLTYLLEYSNGDFRDSIGVVFNQQNQIARLEYYTYLNFSLQPTNAKEYEYIGKNSTEVRYYVLDANNLPNLKLSSTLLFEFDNKNNPFPKETWPFYYVWDNGAIFENNVIKQVVKVDGEPDFETVYSYKYNSDGYPTQMKTGNTLQQEYSYSCEPRLRGAK